MKEALKMAYMVTPSAMTQSIEHRLVALDRDPDGLQRDARRVHVEAVDARRAGRSAKIRNTTTNQAGMALWWAKGEEPAGPVPMLSDERADDRPQGHDQDLGHGRAEEDPADDALLRGVGRAVAGVVVAALGPAEPAQRDGEGQRRP